MSSNEKAENWLNQDIDDTTRQEIKALLAGDSDILDDSFYKDLEFGTGGMRGIMGVGSNRVNKYTLGMATQGLANYLHQCFQNKHSKVAIAYDCRNNSDIFARLVADVLTGNGIEVLLFEALRPTPQLSFTVRHYQCQSGIVITASHNPPEYNGYKVYWDDGAQIVAPHDKGIIDEVAKIQNFAQVNFNGNNDLLNLLSEETDKEFIEASLQQRKTGESNPLKIVFTSLHGTSITLMPDLLNKAGYDDLHIVEAQATPDGQFPTVKSPNPEEREALDMALNLADEIGADMVVGTDPDSDRLGVAIRDNNGQMVLLNGNQCGVLLTDYLLSKSDISGNEFIAYTIVSSELFADVARSYGVQSDVCLTGFKHIASLIRESEGSRTFIGGGEESYGYMIGDFVRDKDAMTSTLIFCDLAAEAKANGSSAMNRLQEIYKRNGLYKEHLISITKKGKSGAEEISEMMESFRNNPPSQFGGEKVIQLDDISSGIRRNLETNEEEKIHLPQSNVLQFYTAEGSKISARPSGTEPKIKFYVSIKSDWSEGKTLEEQQEEQNNRMKSIIKDLAL
ncbi:phospho-sugar mutase [Salibacteraceae bacterium]|nr:phospho-sugar mutase [Salibacteraceae bacterium]